MSSLLPLSVVIPTFERNDSLAALLAALAPGAQTLDAEAYEVIVSDAGVTSNAEALLRERFPWARRIAAPSAPPGVNRNAGARAARGEWLVFIDDDCRVEPGFLAAYHAMATTGRYDVLEGKISCREKVNTPFRRQVENLAGGLLITGNLALRRDVFFSVGPFDEDLRIAEDLELGERLRASGQRIGFCAEAVADHPSQPMRWADVWKWAFHREWFVLHAYKVGAGTPLAAPELAALARTTARELVFLLRITWHLFSQHDAAGWRSAWFYRAIAWLTLPLVLPRLWAAELRYRRAFRDGRITLRPMPR